MAAAASSLLASPRFYSVFNEWMGGEYSRTSLDVVDCSVIGRKRVYGTDRGIATISVQLRSGHSSPRRRGLLIVKVPLPSPV